MMKCPDCGAEMQEYEMCVIHGVVQGKCKKEHRCPKCGKVI